MAETGYKQKAYDYIKKQIVGGALLPGAIVNEKELIQQLEISRTPIREAIQRLAEEGLVVVMPSRGTIVSHISMNDIRQIYEARKLVEPYAVRLAVGHVDPEQMLTYRRIFEEQQNSMEQENDWDSEFHLYLAECSGNQFFKKMVKDLMTQSMRIRVLSNKKKAYHFELSRTEHLAIIDAVLAEDRDGAEKAILSHLIRSEEGYREIYPNQTYFSL